MLHIFSTLGALVSKQCHEPEI